MEPAQIQARYAKLSAQLQHEQERQAEEAQAAQAEADRQAPEAAALEDPSRREDEEEAPGSLAQHEVAGWMSLEEFAVNLRAAGIKKTPEAIKNWLRPDANAPRRFEQNESMSHIDTGKRVILVDPAAALRITRALRNQKPEGGSEGSRTRKKGDSNPSLPAATAAHFLAEGGKISEETGTK